MAEVDKQRAFPKRRDTAEILSAYIDKISERQRRPSVASRSASRRGSTYNCRRSFSNPVISESHILVGRLERRRSAVTFPSTYRTLSLCRTKSTPSSAVGTTSSDSFNNQRRRRSDWNILGHYSRQPKDEKKLTVNQLRIRKSLEYVLPITIHLIYVFVFFFFLKGFISFALAYLVLCTFPVLR